MTAEELNRLTEARKAMPKLIEEVERLNELKFPPSIPYDPKQSETIEILYKENARLREALEKISQLYIEADDDDDVEELAENANY